MLSKTYEPQQYEDEIYRRWEESGFFNPDVCIEKGVTKKDALPFSIVLPPPNVTGTLHIGHAVMLAVEDVMIRYHRMKGDRTLWVPGTDHAAIATQEKVEKLLYKEEGKTRHDLGRDKFLKRVEKFAQESHDTIVRQSKKMGTSMDWSREAFTLDEQRNLAVRTAFKRMYDDGLIYRGHRIVNWDPKMQSTVSDDEVVWQEEKAPFYTFQYGPFQIGTVRPETKFGDKYVVMHPDDVRYKKYKHGDKITVEWINGPIEATIIKDEAVDPEFGTGVMTITPWHTAVDFDIAERHKLEKEQVIDYDGKLLSIAGEFAGMTIGEARPKILGKLKSKELLVSVNEEYIHNVAMNSRGGGMIEPQIKEQWFISVNAEFGMQNSELTGIKEGQRITLKKLMQTAVKSGQIKILPERFEKTYFHWIDNLRDWCISRQLWYGHRIPAWYRGNEVYVGVEAPEGSDWQQDPDTLDTWFSAGLWTFSTLGWPGEMDDLKKFHPTSVLETGYDILFFWVARMILMSTYLLGDIPFKTVYLHGLVRDEQGRKMSKSLDNIIDPLDVCQKYGTDAVRLSLMIGSTPGNDSRLSEEKISSYRNFANKLWNIARFTLLQINNDQLTMNKGLDFPETKTLADQWILSRLTQVAKEAAAHIEQYRFSQAGELLRDFTWSELADWYLEIAKVEGEKFDILNYILNTILKLWHPFMPFVTEAIWQEVYGKDRMLMIERWPSSRQKPEAKSQKPDFEIVREVVSGIRSLRADYKIESGKEIAVTLVCDKEQALLEKNAHLIRGLARVGSLLITSDQAEKPAQSAGAVVGAVGVYVDLAGVMDIVKEKVRLQKEIDHVAPFVHSLEKKLQNKGFVEAAPKAVVEAEQQKLDEAREKLEKLKQQFKFIT